MATLTIGDRKVTIDDGFLNLPPDQQQATVDEIASSFGPPAESKGFLAKATEPITTYLPTQGQMAREGLEQAKTGGGQVATGVRQAVTPTPAGTSEEEARRLHVAGANELIKGVGNTVMGSVGYVASPINAALRTFAGKPVEDVTGIPKEQTEFALGLALPGIGLTKMSKAPPVGGPKTAPSIGELKSAATRLYKDPEFTEVVIKAPAVTRWSQGLRSELTAAGLDENVAETTWKILGKADNAPHGAFSTGRNLESMRRTLGEAAGSANGSERKAAARAIESLDNFFSTVKVDDVVRGDPAKAHTILQEARGNWSAARSAELVDSKMVRAYLRSSAANSGQNVPNTIRQRIADILLDEKALRGFSADERALMERITEGTKTRNAIRVAGNAMGGGMGMGAALYGLASTATHGALAAVPFVGFGLRKLEGALAMRDVRKLSDMVRSDSPLGKQLTGPTVDYAKAAQAFEANPTPRNIAALTLASRNLANNLADAGITVSPDKLLRSIQAPGVGRPESDQPEVERVKPE